MAVQVANFPQPISSPFTAAPFANTGVNGMASPLPASTGNGGMTQLPDVPRPPFLNTPFNTPTASVTLPSASLAPLPPPSALLNNNGINVSNAFNPATSAGLTPLSGTMPSKPSFTTANSLMLAENPPPQMVAPYLYLRLPRQNSYVLPQSPPAMQAPPIAPQPKQLPQTPPPQLPPQPAQQIPPPPQQPPPQPPQTPPQTKDAPKAEIPGEGLDDATIRSLFDQLQPTKDESVRAGATIELLQILQGKPELATDPKYKPYIDAFMQRIMKDKSLLVRGGGETILEMGLIQQPDDKLRGILKELAKKGNSLTNEGNIAAGIESRADAGTLNPLPETEKEKEKKEKAEAEEKAMPGMPGVPGMPPTNGQAAPPSPANGPLPASGETPPAMPSNPASQQGQALPPIQQPSAPMANLPQAVTQPYASPGTPYGGANGMQSDTLAARAASYGIPARMSTGSNYYNPAGGRLNLMSPQQTAMPVSGMAGAGQRLNVREGM